MLIENGACVNHKNNKNETALQIAAAEGNLKILQLLLEHGADDIDNAINLAEANGKLKEFALKKIRKNF